jgi:hypothetical protein
MTDEEAREMVLRELVEIIKFAYERIPPEQDVTPEGVFAVVAMAFAGGLASAQVRPEGIPQRGMQAMLLAQTALEGDLA